MVLPQAPIAVAAATPVPIIAKTWARGVAVSEDATGSGAGLAITYPDGKTVNYTPAEYPVIVAGVVPPINGSPLVGAPVNPANTNPAPATQYCIVESLGAATVVKVLEYN